MHADRRGDRELLSRIQGGDARHDPRSRSDRRLDRAACRFQAGDRMNSFPFDPEAVVDAMAPLLGLRLTPESRRQTILHLRISPRPAELLLSPPLADPTDPPPLFTA